MSMIYMNGALLGTTAFASVLAIAVPAQNGIFHFHDDHVLGTSLDITTVGNDEPAAVLAVSAIRAEISRLDKVLSGWREDSELHVLNAGCATEASSDLFHVIAACEDWREKTGGAYSARLGALLNNVSEEHRGHRQTVLERWRMRFPAPISSSIRARAGSCALNPSSSQSTASPRVTSLIAPWRRRDTCRPVSKD